MCVRPLYNAPEDVGEIRAVGHQTADLGEVPVFIHRWQSVLDNQARNAPLLRVEERRRQSQERSDTIFGCKVQRPLDVTCDEHLQPRGLQAQRSGCRFNLRDRRQPLYMHEDAYSGHRWDGLLEQLKAFGVPATVDQAKPGQISTRTGQAEHKPRLHRVAADGNDRG